MVALDTAEKDDGADKGEEDADDSGELDLEGLDDKELDCYIKSDEEAKATGKVWMALYGADLKEIEGAHTNLVFSRMKAELPFVCREAKEERRRGRNTCQER